MTSEILQRVCPREASLLNDPCIRVKVRLRCVNVKYVPLKLNFLIVAENISGFA